MVATEVVTPKQIAHAQKNHGYCQRERGETTKNIFSHDLLPINPLFEGNTPTKPAKHTVIAEIKIKLNVEECIFELLSQYKTAVLVDFMSQIQIVHMPSQRYFGEAIANVLQNVRAVVFCFFCIPCRGSYES